MLLLNEEQYAPKRSAPSSASFPHVCAISTDVLTAYVHVETLLRSEKKIPYRCRQTPWEFLQIATTRKVFLTARAYARLYFRHHLLQGQPLLTKV